MIIVATLRDLWRRRRSVLVGAAVGMAAAVLLLYSVAPGIPPTLKSRQYTAGVAGAEVLVDSPTSQVVDLGGGNAEEPGQATDLAGLGARAHLLAALMARSPLREKVAAAAGIPADRFVVIAPTGDDPVPDDPEEAKAVAADREMTAIDLFVDETLPIIAMNVRAPDADTAERAARAAVKELSAHVADAATEGAVAPGDQLALARVSEAPAQTVVMGPRRLYAGVAFLFVLALWCGTILMRPRIVDMWREVSEADAAAARQAVPADPFDEPDEEHAEALGAAGQHVRT